MNKVRESCGGFVNLFGGGDGGKGVERSEAVGRVEVGTQSVQECTLVQPNE